MICEFVGIILIVGGFVFWCSCVWLCVWWSCCVFVGFFCWFWCWSWWLEVGFWCWRIFFFWLLCVVFCRIVNLGFCCCCWCGCVVWSWWFYCGSFLGCWCLWVFWFFLVFCWGWCGWGFCWFLGCGIFGFGFRSWCIVYSGWRCFDCICCRILGRWFGFFCWWIWCSVVLGIFWWSVGSVCGFLVGIVFVWFVVWGCRVGVLGWLLFCVGWSWIFWRGFWRWSGWKVWLCFCWFWLSCGIFGLIWFWDWYFLGFCCYIFVFLSRYLSFLVFLVLIVWRIVRVFLGCLVCSGYVLVSCWLVICCRFWFCLLCVGSMVFWWCRCGWWRFCCFCCCGNCVILICWSELGWCCCRVGYWGFWCCCSCFFGLWLVVGVGFWLGFWIFWWILLGFGWFGRGCLNSCRCLCCFVGIFLVCGCWFCWLVWICFGCFCCWVWFWWWWFGWGLRGIVWLCGIGWCCCWICWGVWLFRVIWLSVGSVLGCCSFFRGWCCFCWGWISLVVIWRLVIFWLCRRVFFLLVVWVFLLGRIYCCWLGWVGKGFVFFFLGFGLCGGRMWWFGWCIFLCCGSWWMLGSGELFCWRRFVIVWSLLRCLVILVCWLLLVGVWWWRYRLFCFVCRGWDIFGGNIFFDGLFWSVFGSDWKCLWCFFVWCSELVWDWLCGCGGVVS